MTTVPLKEFVASLPGAGLTALGDVTFHVVEAGESKKTTLQATRGVLFGTTKIGPQAAADVSSSVFLSQSPGAADPLQAPFNFSLATFAGVNSPHSTRPDSVAAIGWNYGPGGRIVGTQPAFGLKFESFYFEAAITTRGPGFEHHMEMVDSAGVLTRPLYTWFPHDGAGDSTMRWKSDAHSWSPHNKNHPWFAATDAVQLSYGSVGSPLATLQFTQQGGIRFAQPANNSQSLITVVNAANTGTNAVSINSSDELRFLFAGATRFEGLGAASGTYANCTVGLACNTPAGGAPATGARGIHIGTFAGKHSGTFFIIDSFARGDDNIIRARTDQTGAMAGVVSQVPGSSTSDAYFRVERNGQTTGTWTFGNDASDNHRFKLSRGLTLGTNDVLTVDPTLNQLTVAGPVRAGSYTVAGLPSAATAGAGSIVYVSNESGGAVLAFSDGTDWRRVTDRVVVS